MGSSSSFRDDDYALVSQQQIQGFRESLDSEAKKSKARSEDRISKLPDEVLHHVLSFIPTEEVVKTSILSTRWRDIWVYVPNWTLNTKAFSSADEFIAFVDRALLIRDSAPIQKFHLEFRECRFEDFSAIDRWIGIAVRCKVVDLDISIEAIDGEDMYELPECLLTCKTLKVWKLCSNHNIKIPSAWCCPSLKSLHVTFNYPDPYSPDNEVMDICNFPVLDYLQIDGYLGRNALQCNISVPSLKTLRITLNGYNSHESYHFLIDAPKLEKLNVSETCLSNYTFRNAQSLVQVYVDVFSPSPIRATKFLAGISGVKCLTLPCHLFADCSVAEFENLNKLTLVRVQGLDRRWWNTLLNFLRRSPSLECLVIEEKLYMIREISSGRGEEDKVIVHKEKCFVIYHEKGKVLPHFSFKRSFDVLYWRPPTWVPKCLLSSLKTITIHGFEFSREEIKLIKCLLKYGRVLENMAIHV